jgi:hypothetical protein
MEEVLPSRFGGNLTDYQLVEEQDATGLPHYALLVSPKIENVNEALLRKTFLDELSKIKDRYRIMIELWSQADILRVRRQSPQVTPSGKFMPFRTLGLCGGA